MDFIASYLCAEVSMKQPRELADLKRRRIALVLTMDGRIERNRRMRRSVRSLTYLIIKSGTNKENETLIWEPRFPESGRERIRTADFTDVNPWDQSHVRDAILLVVESFNN
jgi:hypothetical protein